MKGKKLVWFTVCVLILGAFWLVLTPLWATQHLKIEPSTAKLEEMKRLQARVKALGNNPPAAEWNKVKQALDDWAKKYGVESKQVQQRARPASSGGFTPCPKTVSGPDGYYCYYESSDRGKCYYRCVKL